MGALARGSVRLERYQTCWLSAGLGFEQVLDAVGDATFKGFTYVFLRVERASICMGFNEVLWRGNSARPKRRAGALCASRSARGSANFKRPQAAPRLSLAGPA